MRSKLRFVGLDVHVDSIAVAVADEGGGEARSLGAIPNTAEAVRKLIARLGPNDRLRICYEAGQCGFVLYWQLHEMNVYCAVIAPSLIPQRSGERVKTDRLDALRLARCFRAGELTAILVPTKEQEALRDLLRALNGAKRDQISHMHQLAKFLIRQGRCKPKGAGLLSDKYLNWVRVQQFDQPAHREVLTHYLLEFEHSTQRLQELTKTLDEICEQLPKPTAALVAALQALRGVAKLLAVSLVSELGNLSRFRTPRQLMSYAGVVSREHSSGSKIRRGAITKSGNAHLRRMIVEAAWHYRHRPGLRHGLGKRQTGLSQEVRAIAWKAQLRLTRRYWQLAARKPKPQVVVAVARELLGFIWAIGIQAEKESKLVLIAQPLAREKDPGRPAAAHSGSRLRIALQPPSRPQPSPHPLVTVRRVR
jgi:transposase